MFIRRYTRQCLALLPLSCSLSSLHGVSLLGAAEAYQSLDRLCKGRPKAVSSAVMGPLLRSCVEEGHSTLALKAWAKAQRVGWRATQGDMAMLIEAVASSREDGERDESVTRKLDDLRKMLLADGGGKGAHNLWMELLSACARLSAKFDTLDVAWQACKDSKLTLAEFTQVLEEFREASSMRYVVPLFERAREFGLKPDARLYLTLMKGYASDPKQRHLVFELLASMMSEGLMPNKYVLTLVLRTIVTSRQFHRTGPILDLIDANPIECDLPLLNQMMACASHAANAKPLVERILSAMKLRKIKPDVENYNMRMMLHARLKEIDTAFQLFSQMAKYDIAPNDATFTVLFTACKAAGDVEKAWGLFQHMDRTGCALDNRVHHSILESLFTTRGFSLPHLPDVENAWRTRVKEWKASNPLSESPTPYAKKRGPKVTESRKRFQRKQQSQPPSSVGSSPSDHPPASSQRQKKD